MGLGLVVGLVTAPATAHTLIDMPAPKGALVTFLSENPPARLGAAALNRYSYKRVTPLYTYRSPTVWPSYWSAWGGGYPYGYGYGYGWGRGSWWGHYVIGSRAFSGFRSPRARSRW